MKKIALIGYSFRLPGTNRSRFFNDLLTGVDLVSTVDADRWALDAFRHPDRAHHGTSYTFSAGSIGDVTGFDAAFFNISPREAALMDPQQRLLLELSWEALESAGVKPSFLKGSRCGVFIGIASTDYSYRFSDDLSAIDTSSATGNVASVAANRLSYFYDLHGPSMAIDTACSSSMVAFHQACRSIASGESTHALAGGISLHLHPYGFIIFSKASMLSKRGRCNVFDAASDGYVRSEGGGLFLLKDYEAAVAAGDRILAVVAHSAVNADGRKAGLTVPSANSQATLLAEAYEHAGIAPEEIDYIEAHGTGTAVGDPVETRALGEALGQKRPSGRPLLIGSVKSNLGHLEAASGVSGLIKALYCIQHRIIPATIGIKTINPKIPLQELNIDIVRENLTLKESGRIVVGVNSFGFGGANAHVILESHEPAITDTAFSVRDKTFIPVVLSARSEAALISVARSVAAFLKDHPDQALYDVAYQTVFRRDWLDYRAVVFGATSREITVALQAFAGENADDAAVIRGTGLDVPCGPVFVYSGNGSQWSGMGKQLLHDNVFRKAVREVDSFFCKHAGYSLQDELAGTNGDGRYTWTEIAQPALFAVQVGITRMLRRNGINPVAVVGHSVGEVAAAWACGSLSLEDAVKVVYHRSRLQGATKGDGQMTAVGLGEEEASALMHELGDGHALCLAGINSSRGVTVAGTSGDLERFEAMLTERAIFWKRLDIDYAFHSPAMDRLESEVRSVFADLKPGASVIPFFSTVTGTLLDGRELHAEYWWRNIRKPVQYRNAMNSLTVTGKNVFVEVGPHPVLRSYINDCLKDAGITGCVIPTAVRGDDAPRRVQGAVGQVIMTGVPFPWESVFPEPGRFVELPDYPWQRERHWHDVTPESLRQLYREKEHPLLGYRLAQHELTWENQLDTQTHPVLADHVVGEGIVFPGSGFAELALAAANAWHADDFIEIEELEIRSPLLLSRENSKVLRLLIDPQDGGFVIKSREQMRDEAWTLRVVGRILREPRGMLLNDEKPFLPGRKPDFDYSRHEVMTKAVGLTYGPAFRAISHGWVEQNTASAIFRIPEAVLGELGQYYLHPALLDAAFQLIFQILGDDVMRYDNRVFVPIKIGRLAIHLGAARPYSARATLLRQSPHSLLADFTLFDEAGLPVARIKDVRFRGIRLHKAASSRLSCIDYACVPVPHALVADDRSPLPSQLVNQSLREAVRRCVLKGTHRRYSEEIDPLLDELSSRFVREAFAALDGGSDTSFSERIHACKTITPEISSFIDALVAVLQDDGLIERDDSGLRLNIPVDNQAPTAQDIWNSIFGDYPDYFPIIQAVGRVGMHLQSLIEGHVSFESIRPREASLSSLYRQVLGVQGKQQIEQMLSDLIVEAQKLLPEGRRFRVLELSEGIASYANAIGAAIDFDRGDYVFATSSEATLDEAQSLKASYPPIALRTIDGESPARASDVFHLAIVTLDFTSTHDAVKALQYASTHLAPGGFIMVLAQHHTLWMDFIFGGQQTWWADASSRFGTSHQKTAAFWQRELRQSGFSASTLVEFAPESASGPYVLLAERDTSQAIPALIAEAAPRRWLLIAPDRGSSAQLARHLERALLERGDRALIVSNGNLAHVENLFLNVQVQEGSLDGVVFLAGQQIRKGTAEAIIRYQVHSCAAAASLVKMCEASSPGIPCWLVTSGAVVDLLPGRRASSTLAFADAAVWGFGRTLMNETPDISLRLIDIELPESTDAVASLAREFACPDDEREIIITAAGERFAPRMRLKTCPDRPSAVAREKAQTVLKLCFEMPGQLRNLRWEEHPLSEPAANQLAVRIVATGLNFRDVMYTLGMLSDEAIENGFAGATLGLEFAGVVVSAGAQTRDFLPGDAVVGLGPASFGTLVVTTPNALAHIPPGMSFEAAATIPSTFFTAYYALHHLARLGEGEKVLIHGAAGGVGIAAIQVAKWCGAEIYATAGSDEKRDFLHLLGIEHVFDSRSLVFADEILAQTDGKGVDVVLNSLAGEVVNRNFSVLKPFGRFLELGKRDFYENTKVGLRPFRNNISYFGIDADQLMNERPDLTRKLFHEVIDLFTKGVLHPLPYQVFEADEVVDAFRCMQQARHIGKIVVTYRNEISAVHAVNKGPLMCLDLAAEGAWLVTGGLSGFGLRTAEWLASRGVRNLVLISRSGPDSDEARRSIAVMQGNGVRILAAACDVTDKAALAELLDAASHQFPPLRGIVHAAAVIDDGLIRTMDAEQIDRVLEPKVRGAQNLHELTLEMKLDFFILFSSATTLFGNPGQGNYVAANTWLESLARYRRACGLPATCILWGAIDDVGFLARNEKIKDALSSRMGGRAIHSAVALETLEAMILTNRSGEGVLEFDWKTLSRFIPGAVAPKFSNLWRYGNEQEPGDDRGEDMQRLLAELDDEELSALVAKILQQEVGEILRVAPDKIDTSRSVYDMGLDSLMGVELVVALETRFGIRLPVLAISENPTIAKLARRIMVQLRGCETSSDTTGGSTVISQVQQVAAQHAAEVSPDTLSGIARGISAVKNDSRPRIIQ
ncbi:MAG: SDR family NAD(P)-dependent oxidoreductase [Dissulfurispiraceae bacterium]